MGQLYSETNAIPEGQPKHFITPISAQITGEKPEGLGNFVPAANKPKISAIKMANKSGWEVDPSLAAESVGGEIRKIVGEGENTVGGFSLTKIKELKRAGFSMEEIIRMIDYAKNQVDQIVKNIPSQETLPAEELSVESEKVSRETIGEISAGSKLTMHHVNVITGRHTKGSPKKIAEIRAPEVPKTNKSTAGVLRSPLAKRAIITPKIKVTEITEEKILTQPIEEVPPTKQETVSEVAQFYSPEIENTAITAPDLAPIEVTTETVQEDAVTSRMSESELLESEEIPAIDISTVSIPKSVPKNPFLERAYGSHAEEIISEPIISSPTLEVNQKSPDSKHLAIETLLTTFTNNGSKKWQDYITAIKKQSIETVVQEAPKGLETKAQKSWQDKLGAEATVLRNKFISNVNEKDLITEYVPTYVNPNNPSSWASISAFNASEILHGGEGVYGLMRDTRFEISTLLKQLGEIDERVDEAMTEKKFNNSMTTYNEYLSDNPSITIHDYYEEVRRRIAEADKNEQK
jgi:hypothetical protein